MMSPAGRSPWPAVRVSGERSRRPRRPFPSPSRPPRTWLAVARKAWTERKDAPGARALIEEAVGRSRGNARALAEAGAACAAVEGGGERAKEILAAAVEADPLLAEARLALADLLPGEEGGNLRSLGEALRGSPPAGR